MKHCANESCPDLVRYGVRGEYFDRVAVCPACGEPLVPGPGPPPPTIEWVDLICVATFVYPTEAYLAQAKLEAAGIAASVQDANLSSIQWLYSAAVGGAKLLVSPTNAAEAQRILGEVAPPTVEAAPRDRCPACGAAVPRSRLAYRSKALSLLLGFPFVFRRRRKRCPACGHKWRPQATVAA